MELTKEQDERFKAFKDEYIELTKKHSVELVGVPQFIQLQGGVFGTTCGVQLVDTKQAIVSPIQQPIIQDKE